jgi:hypothetical protein
MKEEKNTILQKYLQEKDLDSLVSISDIEIKEYNGSPLAEEEKKALAKFRTVRVKKLAKEKSKENKFNEKYEYYRTISNLIDYRDILNGNFAI